MPSQTPGGKIILLPTPYPIALTEDTQQRWPLCESVGKPLGVIYLPYCQLRLHLWDESRTLQRQFENSVKRFLMGVFHPSTQFKVTPLSIYLCHECDLFRECIKAKANLERRGWVIAVDNLYELGSSFHIPDRRARPLEGSYFCTLNM